MLARASSLRVREPFALLALQARRASEAVSPELKRRPRKAADLPCVRGSLPTLSQCAGHRQRPPACIPQVALSPFGSFARCAPPLFAANRELSIDFAGSRRLRGFARQQKPRSRETKIPRKPSASRKSIDNSRFAAFFWLQPVKSQMRFAEGPGASRPRGRLSACKVSRALKNSLLGASSSKASKENEDGAQAIVPERGRSRCQEAGASAVCLREGRAGGLRREKPSTMCDLQRLCGLIAPLRLLWPSLVLRSAS